jgi:hypothetical protein
MCSFLYSRLPDMVLGDYDAFGSDWRRPRLQTSTFRSRSSELGYKMLTVHTLSAKISGTRNAYRLLMFP